MDKITVHFHAFYIDELIFYLRQIEKVKSLDSLLITTNPNKISAIEATLKNYWFENKTKIIAVQNYGVNVYPLIKIFLDKHLVEEGYLLHIHTKKSKHVSFGKKWKNYLINNLLGSRRNIDEIISIFKNDHSLELLYPHPYRRVKNYKDKNLGLVNKILEKNYLPAVNHIKVSEFPTGMMFWARTGTLLKLARLNANMEEFKHCNTAVDNTICHAYERLIGLLVKPEQKKLHRRNYFKEIITWVK